jgi:hypothetical protein
LSALLQPGCRREPEMARRLGLYVLAVAAVAAVFALYTRPEFLVTLANQVWACF